MSSLKWLSNNALALLSIVVVTSIVFTVLVGGLAYYQQSQDQIESHDHVKRDAESIGAYILEAMLRNDYQNIMSFVDSWGQRHEDISHISIRASNDFEITSYRRTEPARTPATEHHIVLNEDRKIATVELTYDVSSLLDTRRYARLSLVPYLIGFTVILALIIWVALLKLVLMPMQRIDAKLATTARDLAEAQRISGLGSWKVKVPTGEAFWSDQRYRVFGYEPGEIEPSLENFKKSLHPDDCDRVISEMMDAFHKKEGLDTECRIIWPNGEEHIIHILGEAIGRDDQDSEFMSGTVRDITERTQTEETLRKLSSAVEQSPIAMFITDIHGTIEYVNPKFTDLMGYTPEEVLGQNPRILKSNSTSQAVYEKLWKTISAGKVWQGEIKDRCKNGGTFWSNATISPIRSQDGVVTHYVATHENITERKEAEIKLQEAKEQAVVANRAKSDLMANMSHELRTPLNAIIGFSGSMKEETFGPVGSDKNREYLDDINYSGQHLLELINDILDVSAIEAGAIELHEETVNAYKAVEATVRLIRPRAESGLVIVTSSVDPKLPEIYADERRVKQVLLNLLSNAVKFTPEGGEVSVNAQLNSDGSFSIAVSDNGIGMDEDELTEALSTFGQVDSGLDRKHEGTGLGLPLTAGLMELHGGTLEIHSEKSHGTRITVTFPRERTVHDVS